MTRALLGTASLFGRRSTPVTVKTRTEPRLSSLDRLRIKLASSLDDGTEKGGNLAKQFSQLATVTCACVRQRQHESIVRLVHAYQTHDPSAKPAIESSSPASAEDASALCASLHKTLRRAGFRLFSLEDELRAVHGHFGDESMWHMPVVMSQSGLDSSLTAAESGGFDPYQVEAAAGRAVARPSFANKVLVYYRGVGTVEKTGYFMAEKFEQLVVRACHRVASQALGRMRRLVEPMMTSVSSRMRSLGPIKELLWPEALPTSGASSTASTFSSPPENSSLVGLASIDLSLRSLFEETSLSAPTYGHVLLAYRHADALAEAHGNEAHVALGIFRRVPQSDLELLLPHMQVRMPEMQLYQFYAAGLIGLLAASPLLQHETLSLTGIVTMYTALAYALRTGMKWRTSKQLYQQLLLSYQYKNRLGSADGALILAGRLAEEEQQTIAMLALHALMRAQQRTADGVLSAREVRLAGGRVLKSWSELASVDAYLHDETDWRMSPLPDLIEMGVVERVQRPHTNAAFHTHSEHTDVGQIPSNESEAPPRAMSKRTTVGVPSHSGDALATEGANFVTATAHECTEESEVLVRLRPVDDALLAASKCWNAIAADG